MNNFVKKPAQAIDSRGFSLVEVIVAMGILAFLAIGATDIFLTSWRDNTIAFNQLGAQNEGRKATQDFVSILRMASMSNIGAYPIDSVSSTAITFYGSPDANTLRSRVRYFVANGTLKMGVTKPDPASFVFDPANEVITEVAHNIVNTSTPIFSYYDSNYSGVEAPLPDPVNVYKIRTVKIFLQLDPDPSASLLPFSVEAEASVRSLKDN